MKRSAILSFFLMKASVILLSALVIAGCEEEILPDVPEDPSEKPEKPEEPDDPDEPEEPEEPEEPDTPVETYSIDGFIQKGPFTQGTSIMIQALDDQLNPTGKNYNTKTTDDAGTFGIGNEIESRFIEVIASGYYFNEITGSVSTSEITLRSISDLKEAGQTNVNLLTMLECDRIRYLVKEGKSMAEARTQAEKELFEVFNIPNAVSESSGFDKMDMTKDGENNAILLAISASLQAGRTVGELSELINKIAADLEKDGKVNDPNLLEKILDGCKQVNSESVTENLEKRYRELGLTDFEIPPFEDYLDTDGNGVIDKKDTWIIVGQNEFTVSDEGGEIAVSVQHNKDFDVLIEEASWISVKPEDPSTQDYLMEKTVYFIVERNESYDDRYAIIKIRDKESGHYEQVMVTQMHKNALIVSPKSVELDRDGGNFSIEVKYTDNTQYEISESWIHAAPATQSLNVAEVAFMADPNPAVETRSGKITFRMDDRSETVTVYQTGGKSIVLSEKTLSVDSEGGNYEIKVSANIEYIAESQSPWISVNMRTPENEIARTAAIYVAQNQSEEDRTGTVVFRDLESDYSETLTIVQERDYSLWIDRTEFILGYSSGTLEIPMSSNFRYTPEVVEGGDWLSIVQTKSVIESTLTLSYTENNTASVRTGEIRLNIDENTFYTLRLKQITRSEQTVVTLLSPGSLAQELPVEQMETIKNLKLVGEANSDDFEYLQNHEDKLKMEELDLSELTSSDMKLSGFNRLESLIKVTLPIDVRTITQDCFTSCPNLSELIFPEGCRIQEIAGDIPSRPDWAPAEPVYGAFMECTALTEVNLPASLTTLNACAFSFCTSLRKVTFAENSSLRKIEPVYAEVYNVMAQGYRYPRGLFRGCTALEVLELPSSVRTVKDGAFSTCGAKKIIIPSTVTTVGTFSLFSECDRLVEVVMPPVTEIKEEMFYRCAALEKVSFDLSKVTKIGKRAFAYSSGNILILDPNVEYGESVYEGIPVSTLTIPDNVREIPARAFEKLPNLQSLDLNQVSIVGPHAFSSCPLLKEVDLSSVEILEAGAFGGCTAIEKIELPQTLHRLDDRCFQNSGLKDLEIKGDSLVIGSDFLRYTPIGENSKFVIPRHVRVITSCSSVDENSNDCDSPLRNFTRIEFEPGSVCTTFGIAAESEISEIELPPTIKRIARGAFYGCKYLRTIDLPENVESIGDCAFSCSGLEELVLPASVVSVGDDAFYNCRDMYRFEIPENSRLAYIYTTSFSFRSEMQTELTIHGAEELHIEDVWNKTVGLQKVIFGKGIKAIIGGGYRIGTCVFEETTEPLDLSAAYHLFMHDTRKIYIHRPVSRIGDRVFYSDDLEHLEMDWSQVESIGEKNKFPPASFTNVGEFSRLTRIDSYFFKNAVFKEVNFPKVEYVGENAFENAVADRISLPAATNLRHNAFLNMTIRSKVLELPSLQKLTAGPFQGLTLDELHLPSLQLIDSAGTLRGVTVKHLDLSSMSVLKGDVFNGMTVDDLILSSLKTIEGGGSFRGLTLNSKVLELPSLETLRTAAFDGLTLDELNLPELRSIEGEGSFKGLTVKQLSLPLLSKITCNDRLPGAFSGLTITSKVLELPALETLTSVPFDGLILDELNLPALQFIEGEGSFKGLTVKQLNLPLLSDITCYNNDESPFPRRMPGVFDGLTLDELNLPSLQSIESSISVFNNLTVGHLSLPLLSSITNYNNDQGRGHQRPGRDERSGAFSGLTINSKVLELPALETLKTAAFDGLILDHLSLPSLQSIEEGGSFRGLTLNSKVLELPALQSVGVRVFTGLILDSLNLPAVKKILHQRGESAFTGLTVKHLSLDALEEMEVDVLRNFSVETMNLPSLKTITSEWQAVGFSIGSLLYLPAIERISGEWCSELPHGVHLGPGLVSYQKDFFQAHVSSIRFDALVPPEGLKEHPFIRLNTDKILVPASSLEAYKAVLPDQADIIKGW